MKEGLRFDWYSELSLPIFATLIEDVIVDCQKQYKNKNKNRTKSLELLTHRILSALYSAHFIIPKGTRFVSFPKTKDAYSLKDVSKVNFNSDYALVVFNVLKNKGWIKDLAGSEAAGYTRIQASGNLKKVFNKYGLRWSQQTPLEREKIIVIRDRKQTSSKKNHYKKFDVPVPDTPEVNQQRAWLYNYNSFLTKHCVSLNLTDKQLLQVAGEVKKRAKEDTEDEIYKTFHLDLHRTQLRRIYARGSLEKGGRFYGGWWQGVPSEYRGHILIDGKKTVEVDYSGMSLRIWHAMNDLPLSPKHDIYNLGFNDWQGDSDPRRKPIKKFLNAALNDEKGNYRLPKEELETLGFVSHKDLRARLFATYPQLEEAIHAGIGLETQFMDSQIAMMVMDSMMRDEILVLPIHDSFIIRAGFQQTLQKVMVAAFAQLLGAKIGTSIDGTRLTKHFGIKKDAFKLLKSSNADIVNLASVDIYKDDQKIMDGYLDGWLIK